MAQIRPFVPDDTTAVARLFYRVFRAEQGSSSTSTEGLARYMREVYFEHPFDREGPSGWVAEDGGRCIGFLGCFPRAWKVGNREVRVAAGSNFMVSPEVRDPFLAGQLLRSMFRGPFDLCLTDTGNESARKIWTQNGALLATHASLHWFRLLRPARAALLGARERMGLGVAAELGRPFAWLGDAIVGRTPRMPVGLSGAPMSMDEAAAMFIDEARRASVAPAYSTAQVRWLLEQSAKRSSAGPLLFRRYTETAGGIVGWSAFHAPPGRIGQVVALGGRPDRYLEVLRATMHDAHDAGCVAVIGKADRGRLREYGEAWSPLFHRSNYVLFRTEDRDVREAFLAGEARLTRLEGDWWTRFQGEDLEAPVSSPSA